MSLLAAPNVDRGLAPHEWKELEARGGQWFVVHTKSRQEKALAQILYSMRVTFFLPLLKRTSYRGRRKLTTHVPMFPSYIFLRGELEDAYMADRTKRVARVIPAFNQEQIHRELRNIHLALTKEANLDPYAYLTEGIWVEVRSGPFQGLQGVIESQTRSNRLVLQIETLGQAMSLEIDRNLVEPLG